MPHTNAHTALNTDWILWAARPLPGLSLGGVNVGFHGRVLAVEARRREACDLEIRLTHLGLRTGVMVELVWAEDDGFGPLGVRVDGRFVVLSQREARAVLVGPA